MSHQKKNPERNSQEVKELEKLVDICHANLKNSKECLDYLKKRGLSDEVVAKHKIGYFPQNTDTLIKYVSEEVLFRLGIIGTGRRSKFADHFYLIFPVFSEYGFPIGIGGRTLLSDLERDVIGIPKYCNSDYKKSQVLYGLNQAKDSVLKKDRVYVVEGYFDYIALDSNGITNSAAVCSASFSRGHLIKLARLTENIFVMMDNDEAGEKSANRTAKILSQGNLDVNIKFLRLPNEYKDVDNYFSSADNNVRTFAKDVKQFVPYIW